MLIEIKDTKIKQRNKIICFLNDLSLAFLILFVCENIFFCCSDFIAPLGTFKFLNPPPCSRVNCTHPPQKKLNQNLFAVQSFVAEISKLVHQNNRAPVPGAVWGDAVHGWILSLNVPAYLKSWAQNMVTSG